MEASPKNPGSIELGPGVSEEQVRTAIEKSGYPLQSVIGNLLRSTGGKYHDSFFVQEEWCYQDEDSKDLRTIDLLASLPVYDYKALFNETQPRVRPELNILVECKQSPLPFVFFNAGIGSNGRGDFPTIAGLFNDAITVYTDDDPSTWSEPLIAALGLQRHPFQSAPRFCHTLSKCVRKGAELELSGSDAYNGLVLPLVKSLKHFVKTMAPPSTAWYFDCRLAVAVAVLDAPMLSAGIGEGGVVLTDVPWVRVLRHEYKEGDHQLDREMMCFIDVVHKDFFGTYLKEHLVPFAEGFGQSVLRHPTEIAVGTGFISGMEKDSWSNLEERLQPRPFVNARRSSRIAGNIFKALFGRLRK